jgi:Uma2 family endonuclease
MAVLAARLDPAEYLRLERSADRKHEYGNGERVEMPGVSQAYSRIQTELAYLCRSALGSGSCEYNGSDLKVRVGGANYVYPDGTIACGALFQEEVGDVLLNPTVVFEILSPSTEAYDLGDKFRLYEQLESLRDYVLIASERAGVVVYSRQEDGWLRRSYEGEAIVRVPSVALDLPLSELYARALAA